MCKKIKAKKYIRNNKVILAFQYTNEYMQYLISEQPNEYDDDYYIVICGMADTEFFWSPKNKELKIIYSNYLNDYENVTPENYRCPEIINIDDFIVRDNYKYHIESKDFFNKSIKFK